MNLYFDFDGQLIVREDITPNTDARKIVDKVQSFVETRLAVLSDEIYNEANGKIIIDIGKPEIRYYYSENLATKMMGSITEDDFKYIMSKIFFEINQQ